MAVPDLIDLYSDTVTRPTPGMRQAIANAEVGDEQRDEDPTTMALQLRTAALLGKERAIFLPSATMANALATRLHTRPGEAVIMDADCHLLNSEAGGMAAHSGAIPRIIRTERGHFTPEQVAVELQRPNNYRPRTTMLECEQTHNGRGGTIWPLDQLQAVCDFAHENGLKTHLDGARLFNATVATGISPAEYGAGFDTITLCLSKGLGAPTGALLLGTNEAMAEARVLKQLFGGAMRQSGILAAAAVYALDHHVDRLAEDHENAQRLAKNLADIPNFKVEPAETNMVFVDISGTGMTGPEMRSRLREEIGVHVSAPGHQRLRLVTHLDVSADDVDEAAERIRKWTG